MTHLDLSILNERQREAVEAPDGATLVLAGPGSGKTRVLTYRVAWLVQNRRIPPWRIMAVTFTNKAAREMKDRLLNLIGQEALDQLTIGTFHAVCARILRVDGAHVGLERAFVIFDTDDQTALVKQIVQQLNLNDKTYRPGALLNAISKAKNELIPPDAYTPATHWHEIARRVYERYQAALQANNAVDFDDLLMKTAELLRDHPDVLDKYRRRYAHILVDEFQDTNRAQYELIKTLAGPEGNIYCVGDEDQCVPAGTPVQTASGVKPIEDITVGERVVAAFGRGIAGEAPVEAVKSKPYHGPLVEIVTQRGHVLRATPNHMLFARLGMPTNRHYVYLMYRRDKGYRLGLVQGARSDGVHDQLVSGLQQRGNQEHADKVWLLKVCAGRGEAQYYESLFAARYGLPTMVFHTIGRDMQMDAALVDKLYQELDTATVAQRLMADLYLYFDYPHHRPKGVAGERLPDRIAVNLIMFSDTRRSARQPWNGHRVTLNTTDRQLQTLLEEQGYPTRPGRRNTWRLDGQRMQFGEASVLAQTIADCGGGLEIARSAFLTATLSPGGTTIKYDFQPASHIHPTMLVPVLDAGRIIDDEVVEVNWLDYEGPIFDLNVTAVHNYVTNGVVVHNSIYGWRGADFRNVMRFREDYRDALVILLEQNYRSSRTILDAAQGVIRGNRLRHAKTLWTENDAGLKISLYEAYNEQEEADYVVGEIQRLIARKQTTYRETAVMYRTNAQSRVLEDAFVRRGIPYRLVGATRFYERREVKDVLAYLRLAHNPLDSISLRRIINVPTRGIGDKTITNLWAWAERLQVPPYTALTLLRESRIVGAAPLPIPAPFDRRAENALVEFAGLINGLVAATQSLDVQALLNLILQQVDYESYIRDGTEEGDSRWENVLELKTVAGDYASLPPGESLPTFLEEVALVADVDELDTRADAVTLLTLHAAKGLEYDTVFLIGLEEGIVPHQRSLEEQSAEAIEEERRLCYVGMTRARQRLYLLYAFRRAQFGASNLTEPSRFLRDIPHTLVNAQVERRLAPQPPRVGIRASRGIGGPAPTPTAGRSAFKLGQDSRPAPARSARSGTFRAGDKVIHAVFGDGTVLNSKPSGDDEEVEVIFKGGAKKLLGSYLKKK